MRAAWPESTPRSTSATRSGMRRRRIQRRRDVAPSRTKGAPRHDRPTAHARGRGRGHDGRWVAKLECRCRTGAGREGWRGLPGRRWAAPSLPGPQRLPRGRGVRVTRGSLARRSRSLATEARAPAEGCQSAVPDKPRSSEAPTPGLGRRSVSESKRWRRLAVPGVGGPVSAVQSEEIPRAGSRIVFAG
jgi:hypothetical protein